MVLTEMGSLPLRVLTAFVWIGGAIACGQTTATPTAGAAQTTRGPGYVLLRDPQFVATGDATFLNDGDQVLGVSMNGVSHAYPRRFIAYHHIVHDRLGNQPILATWCNLCSSGVVFKNEMQGRQLTPDLAGVNGSNMTFRDRETGTRWQQATGEAYEGPLAGSRLEIIPFSFTTWAEWKQKHPDTMVLKPVPERSEEYEAMARREARTRSLPRPERPILREDDRLGAHKLIYGLDTGGAQKAYPAAQFSSDSVLNDQIGTAAVLLVHVQGSSETMALSRVVAGEALSFRRAEGSAWMVDAETGSQWNEEGECIAGRLKGSKLEVIPLIPSFWFAWAEFYPETALHQM